MNPTATKSNKGFTLMELIIVMALLAIIAAILIPMFLNTTDRARLRSDIQSARVIQNAKDLYQIETSRTLSGNAPDIVETLAEAGYLDSRNITPQTEEAIWGLDNNGRVVVDISRSSQSIRDLVENLSVADRQMVTGVGS